MVRESLRVMRWGCFPSSTSANMLPVIFHHDRPKDCHGERLQHKYSRKVCEYQMIRRVALRGMEEERPQRLCVKWSKNRKNKTWQLWWEGRRSDPLPEKAHCKEVFLNRLFCTRAGTASLLSSTTTLIPSLSDSSLKSEIPSNFLSLTRSAIFSNRAAIDTKTII